jgi:hypothetical protein
MQNQVPLWITLVLAVIAIMGPIGGALIGGMITARRDDRRWQLELEREEARWAREADRENHKYWLNLRTVSHSSTIEYLRQFVDIGGDIVAALKGSDGNNISISNELKLLKKITGDLESALVRSEICSTTKMQHLSIEVSFEVARFTNLALRTQIEAYENKDVTDAKAEVESQFDSLRKKNDTYTNMIKNELDIPGGTWD